MRVISSLHDSRMHTHHRPLSLSLTGSNLREWFSYATRVLSTIYVKHWNSLVLFVFLTPKPITHNRKQGTVHGRRGVIHLMHTEQDFNMGNEA